MREIKKIILDRIDKSIIKTEYFQVSISKNHLYIYAKNIYNYIVLSTPMGILCNFLHKKINSNKFAFFRIVSIIITVQRTSDNEQGAQAPQTGRKPRASP